MAFTRKFLIAMGVEESKVDTIMDAHIEVTDALKKERDGYKAEAAKLPDLQKQLEDAQKASDGKDYKKLYEELDKSTKAEKARAGKTEAYKQLLKSAGVSEKFVGLIVKANAADIDSLELGEDGKAKNADDLVKEMKTSLADYIGAKKTKGTDVPTPPGNDPGGITKEAFDKMSYRERAKLFDEDPEAYAKLTE